MTASEGIALEGSSATGTDLGREGLGVSEPEETAEEGNCTTGTVLGRAGLVGTDAAAFE